MNRNRPRIHAHRYNNIRRCVHHYLLSPTHLIASLTILHSCLLTHLLVSGCQQVLSADKCQHCLRSLPTLLHCAIPPPGAIVSTMHSASAIVNSFFFIVIRTSLYSSVCLCLFCPKPNTNASTLQYLRNERAYSVLKNRFLANMVDILSYIIQ